MVFHGHMLGELKVLACKTLYAIIFSIFNQIFIMARVIFNSEMEQYLLNLVRNGEDGNIYRCLVLRSDNQKLKVRDAWTWVHNSFNRRFGTQIPKDILRKKFSYLRRRVRLFEITSVSICRGRPKESRGFLMLFNLRVAINVKILYH